MSPVFCTLRQRLRPETAIGTEYPVNVSGNELCTDLTHTSKCEAKNIPITSTLLTDHSLVPGGKVRCLTPIQSIQTAIQQITSNFIINSRQFARDHTYSTQFSTNFRATPRTREQSLIPAMSNQTRTTFLNTPGTCLVRL